MICAKCYNEYSWLDEKCPNCGEPAKGRGRWVRRLRSRPVELRWQFSLQRMFIGMTMMALGIGLCMFATRPGLFQVDRTTIQDNVTMLLLVGVAIFGAGAGSLYRRPIWGAAFGAAASIWLAAILYAIALAWAFSHIKPPSTGVPTVTNRAGQFGSQANESAVQ
jgi:hypothetical protein